MRALIALIICIALVACSTPPSGPPATETQQPPMDTPGADTTPTGSVTAPGTAEQPSQAPAETSFAMDVDEYAFTPNRITVKQGTPVTITLVNKGSNAHGFGLLDFNVNQYIGPGETKTVTFTPDKKGTYTYFCTVPCGSGHASMRGTLIVE